MKELTTAALSFVGLCGGTALFIGGFAVLGRIFEDPQSTAALRVRKVANWIFWLCIIAFAFS